MDLPSMGLGPRIAGALGMDRKKHERAMEQAVEENPGAHLAGALIGPGGAESLAGRMAIGGFQGGITAAAKSKADEPTISDAGGGAAIGTIGTLIAEGLLRGSGKLIGPVLQKVARSQALRALNPLKRDVTMLANQGIESKVADDLLESGVMKPFSNSANIAERVAPELEKRGAAVGASRSAIDDAARGDVVRPSDLAAKFEDLADDYADKPTPEMQSIARDLNSRAELIRSKPHLSLTEAEQSIKQPMDVYAERMARTTGSPPDKLEALAQARRLIKEGNEEAAHAVDPALAEKFIGAKGDYGRMAAVANILERNNPRALANRGLSPSDYGFGIATGQGYQPPASLPGEESGEKAIGGLYGMLAAKLHQQVRERGNSTLAHAANVGAKLARHAGAATVPASRASVGGLAPYIELLEEEKK
jgi:hypothetical protein